MIKYQQIIKHIKMLSFLHILNQYVIYFIINHQIFYLCYQLIKNVNLYHSTTIPYTLHPTPYGISYHNLFMLSRYHDQKYNIDNQK